MDMKARRPARRHALARNFRFDRTRFILYHLVLECLQLGQVLVNGSSRLPYTYCKGSEGQLKSGCRISNVHSANLLRAKQPGTSIRAVKKTGPQLTTRAAGKLEEDNLFRIRKFF
jgi:hypothetical protein